MIRITAVIENNTDVGLPVEHGLALWIEADGKKFFFDLGQSSLFLDNARSLGIDVPEAQFAIISHGHYDHGGGIPAFLEANDHAPVYVCRRAFGEYFSTKENVSRYIGLDKRIEGNSRIVVNDDIVRLSDNLIIFRGCDGRKYFSPANSRILKMQDDKLVCDDFQHEQSLIIVDGPNRVLIAGCAHSGILNIKERAERLLGEQITHIVSGLHLMGVTDKTFVSSFGDALLQTGCICHTCHCTGLEAYDVLKAAMGDAISYLSCGNTIEIV